MRENNIIGIDLAKNIMHLVQTDETGKIIWRKKAKRDELITHILQADKSTLIAMEACNSCNYWAQEIGKLGFSVKLVKTKDAKIYAQSKQKNDYNDALAITKAARDPELKSVRAKNKEEQDISFIHKTRANTMRDRIQKTNSMMSSLEEYGYVTTLSKGRFCKECEHEVRSAYREKYISEKVCQILLNECKEIAELCNKLKKLDQAIVQSNKESKKAIRLQSILGIGPINASCLSIAPMESYPTPRDFAASLGLVPKQHSSGDKVVLGSITKQGDRYARTMLIQAGRTIAIRAKNVKDPQDKLLLWARKKFTENKKFNVICVGLANKLARIAYSVIVRDTQYKAS